MDWPGIIVGFVLGVFGSLIASQFWDTMTRPKLSVALDPAPALGVGFRWFNLRFSNVGNKQFGADPRPAWSCTASLSLYSANGKQMIRSIPARWTSTPEPLITVAFDGHVVKFPELEKMLAGRRIDIYSHEDQLMPLLLKYDKEEACYLFTNECYNFPPRNVNPDWGFGFGKYIVRVAVHYDRGTESFFFLIHNYGSGMNEVNITLLPRESVSIQDS